MCHKYLRASPPSLSRGKRLGEGNKGKQKRERQWEGKDRFLPTQE